MRTFGDNGRGTRARVCGLFVLCLMVGSGAVAQKASYPEITQLQGPQKPRLGFMAQIAANGSSTADEDKAIAEKLKSVVDVAGRGLRRGLSADAAVRLAIRTLGTYAKTHAFGVIALDKKAKLATGPQTKSGASAVSSNSFCAASAIGKETMLATAVCSDVGQAMTVQGSVDSEMKKLKNSGTQSVIVIDKFGNMGLSPASKQWLRAYIGPDGKTVLENK